MDRAAEAPGDRLGMCQVLIEQLTRRGASHNVVAVHSGAAAGDVGLVLTKDVH